MKSLALAMLIASGLATSVTAQTGTLTHTSYKLKAADRAVIVRTMSSYLKAQGIELQGLKATESLSTGAVAVCGYLTGLTPAGVRSKPAIFGGQFLVGDHTKFFPFSDGGGKGASQKRAQVIKIICDANGIGM